MKTSYRTILERLHKAQQTLNESEPEQTSTAGEEISKAMDELLDRSYRNYKNVISAAHSARKKKTAAISTGGIL